MINSQSCVINRCCGSHKDSIAAYRLLRNDSWCKDDVVRAMSQACASNVSGLSHILLIGDTSELNFDNMSGRLSKYDPDFGPGTDSSMEFSLFVHPTLAVDAENYTPLGLAHVDIWSRKRDRSDIPDRHVRPLEQKESFKWASGPEAADQTLPKSVRKTYVYDREGDIYEVISRIKNSGSDLVVRSRINRHTEDGLLWDSVRACDPSCTYELVVRRKGEPTRTALMEMRWLKTTIKSPVKKGGRESLGVTCVYTREVPGTTPDGVEPVEWKILTTHDVGNVEEAMRIITWYKMRWLIEELFSVIKSRGMDVGEAQLESGKAMKKLIALSLYAALAIMVAKMALDASNEEMGANVIFSEEQIVTLHAMMRHLHKESPKAKGGRNPYEKESMPWAAWIIARMGGWSGYEKAQGRPGYKTLSKGLDVFYTWHLARTCCDPPQKDVYKD